MGTKKESVREKLFIPINELVHVFYIYQHPFTVKEIWQLPGPHHLPESVDGTAQIKGDFLHIVKPFRRLSMFFITGKLL